MYLTILNLYNNMYVFGLFKRGYAVDIVNYTDLRKHLASTMDKVIQERMPIVITRQNSEPIVMMSLKDFNAYQETAYLLNNPKNAARLRDSVKAVKSGHVSSHALLEDEA